MRGAADPVADSYDELAGAYDTLTADYDYERWLGEIERLARRHGLRGRTVLDVACGTGSSFLPLLARGYAVTGCDVSPRMLERAARKAPGTTLHVADMRTMASFGAFDLVTCLDDSLNHLLEPDDLRAALAGIRRNLAPAGVAVWDVNTLKTYATGFSESHVLAGPERFVAWEGRTGPVAPGAFADVVVHSFARDGQGAWLRSTSSQRQRHWPEPAIRAAAAEAGLRIAQLCGQHAGVVLDAELDEQEHSKALYVATRADRGGGDGMDLWRP